MTRERNRAGYSSDELALLKQIDEEYEGVRYNPLDGSGVRYVQFASTSRGRDRRTGEPRKRRVREIRLFGHDGDYRQVKHIDSVKELDVIADGLLPHMAPEDRLQALKDILETMADESNGRR